jgi:hypothetical protein
MRRARIFESTLQNMAANKLRSSPLCSPLAAVFYGRALPYALRTPTRILRAWIWLFASPLSQASTRGNHRQGAESKPPPRRLATLQDQLCTSIGGNLDTRASSTLNSSVMTITILSPANAVGNEGSYYYATPLNGGNLRIAVWANVNRRRTPSLFKQLPPPFRLRVRRILDLHEPVSARAATSEGLAHPAIANRMLRIAVTLVQAGTAFACFSLCSLNCCWTSSL